ncbi:hypothetical protein HII31_06635 [Pseudocercospora fuligena]|uniref:Uncharacterized protein n=1 Tax=Pseudocercospora fuligena TaxID=685502 RepID=A0A8H6VMC6_9PEZI|nr:hypothetical protein HII31_06635 [Pseudocercospora fuligena]
MSFLRRLSHSLQPWDRRPSEPRTDDLYPSLKDKIFTFQLSSPNFCRITTETLLLVEIVDSQTYAEKVLKACQKIGILDPETGRPDTYKIDRNIVKSMPTITVEKQRRLVMLLFFWEEECTRWKLLEGEEEEVRGKLGEEGLGEGYREQFEMMLRLAEMKKAVLPSERDESGRVLQSGEEEVLPSYEEVGRR